MYFEALHFQRLFEISGHRYDFGATIGSNALLKAWKTISPPQHQDPRPLGAVGLDGKASRTKKSAQKPSMSALESSIQARPPPSIGSLPFSCWWPPSSQRNAPMIVSIRSHLGSSNDGQLQQAWLRPLKKRWRKPFTPLVFIETKQKIYAFVPNELNPRFTEKCRVPWRNYSRSLAWPEKPQTASWERPSTTLSAWWWIPT